MRIIAGKYRGRRLKSPPSLRTRPTSDRLRETLFNILAPRIEGARFLDLCAGSGAAGMEALSRGAAHTVFVDQSREMCALIGANLETLEITGNELVIACSEAVDWLQKRARSDADGFDIVFFDPPYSADYEVALDYIASKAETLLAKDGLVVVEHHKKNELPAEVGKLKRRRSLKQGDSCLSFYEAS